MKKLVLLALLVLGSAGVANAQSAAKTTQTPAQTPALAPLPNEADQKLGPDAGAANAPATAPTGDLSVWDFVKMFLILALVLGMIWGFLWFMRKLSGQGTSTDSLIKTLHTHVLSGNRTLQVVEIANEVLLLGTGDSGVTLVKDLTGTEAADAFLLAASQGKAGGKKTGFSDLLGGLMGFKPKIRPDVSQPVDNSSDFLKKQRERLKKL